MLLLFIHAIGIYDCKIIVNINKKILLLTINTDRLIKLETVYLVLNTIYMYVKGEEK